MKQFLFSLYLFINIYNAYSQLAQDELTVVNSCTATDIYVRVYPVSTIYNALDLYTIVAATRPSNTERRWDYMNCVNYITSGLQYDFLLEPQASVGFNSDEPVNNSHGSSYGGFGFGIYKVVIRYYNSSYQDSVLVEFDRWIHAQQQMPGDLKIIVKDFNVQDRFTYQFTNVEERVIPYRGYKINIWEHGYVVRNKQHGNLLLKNYSSIYDYDYFPLDVREQCKQSYNSNFLVEQNHFFPIGYDLSPYPKDNRQGNISLNLTIQKPVSSFPQIWAHDYYGPQPVDIVILQGATLTLDKLTNNQSTLTLNKYNGVNLGPRIWIKGYTSPPTGCLKLNSGSGGEYTKLTVNEYCGISIEPYALLWMGNNSVIDLNNGSTSHFYTHSKITSFPNSHINIYNGGKLYDCGAIFTTQNFNINVKQGGRYILGAPFCYESPIIQNFDNMTFQIDSGIVEIGNGCKFVFDGDSTLLKIGPGSTIKFGEGASMEFKNGARLVADSAKFLNLDGSANWDGVYLEGTGSDTITNCAFENALNGISISMPSET